MSTLMAGLRNHRYAAIKRRRGDGTGSNLRALATGQTGGNRDQHNVHSHCRRGSFLRGMRRNHWRHDSGTTVSLAFRISLRLRHRLSQCFRVMDGAFVVCPGLRPGICSIRALNGKDTSGRNHEQHNRRANCRRGRFPGRLSHKLWPPAFIRLNAGPPVTREPRPYASCGPASLFVRRDQGVERDPPS